MKVAKNEMFQIDDILLQLHCLGARHFEHELICRRRRMSAFDDGPGLLISVSDSTRLLCRANLLQPLSILAKRRF